MERNEAVHVLNGLSGELSHAVIVKDQILKRSTDVVEDVAGNIADLVARQVDIDKSGSVHEKRLGEISDLVAFEIQNTQGTKSSKGSSGNLGQLVALDVQFNENVLKTSEGILVEGADAVLIQDELLDPQITKSIGTKLNNVGVFKNEFLQFMMALLHLLDNSGTFGSRTFYDSSIDVIRARAISLIVEDRRAEGRSANGKE